jgi:hypothetical protein
VSERLRNPGHMDRGEKISAYRIFVGNLLGSCPHEIQSEALISMTLNLRFCWHGVIK